MRMRKLGHGQSVMFYAPLEVDRSIRNAAGKSVSQQISTLDILRWAMLETCNDIVHNAPHWAQQGLDHERRQNAWNKYFSSDNSTVEQLKSSWLQPEARTLEEMYGLHATGVSHHPAFTIPALRERCEMLGVLSFADTRLEEEQEREVSQEAERERQIERPPKENAARHQVHEDVRHFVRKGVIPPKSSSSSLSASPWTQPRRQQKVTFGRQICSLQEISR
jgi:hypothetical protein